MNAIEATDLRRTYRSRASLRHRERREVDAVRGVTFEVPRGTLFGLLGPNGAGKTTTIKMLTTLLLPTAGNARVLGHDVVAEPVLVRRRIGYVAGGDRGLYDRLSAYDNLRYFAELYGLPTRGQAARIGELIEMVGLGGRERDRVERYSRGMRQRLHIARGLLHDPDVLFLDEPTIGLDPVAARAIRRLVAALVEAGRTVLLSTHHMMEADELCQQVAVIAQGRLRAIGTPTELRKYAADRQVIVAEVDDLDAERLARLRELDGAASVTVERRDTGDTVTVQAGDDLAGLRTAVGTILDGLRISAISVREPTLEDAYVALLDEATECVP